MKFYKSNISFIFIFVMVLSISSIAQEDAQIEGDEMSLENRKDLESLKDILTMQKLLEITRSDGFQTSVVNSKREEQFIDARDQQKFLLDQAKLRLQEEEERSIRLQSEFENNEKILEEIGETLRIRIGNFGELFGVFRQVAGEVIATVKNSIVSLQFPNREIALAVMAETKGLPSISQMKSLVVSMLEEMTQSGRVERFQGEVVLPGGSLANAEIVRVGVLMRSQKISF